MHCNCNIIHMHVYSYACELELETLNLWLHSEGIRLPPALVAAFKYFMCATRLNNLGSATSAQQCATMVANAGYANAEWWSGTESTTGTVTSCWPCSVVDPKVREASRQRRARAGFKNHLALPCNSGPTTTGRTGPTRRRFWSAFRERPHPPMHRQRLLRPRRRTHPRAPPPPLRRLRCRPITRPPHQSFSALQQLATVATQPVIVAGTGPPLQLASASRHWVAVWAGTTIRGRVHPTTTVVTSADQAPYGSAVCWLAKVRARGWWQ